MQTFKTRLSTLNVNSPIDCQNHMAPHLMCHPQAGAVRPRLVWVRGGSKSTGGHLPGQGALLPRHFRHKVAKSCPHQPAVEVDLFPTPCCSLQAPRAPKLSVPWNVQKSKDRVVSDLKTRSQRTRPAGSCVASLSVPACDSGPDSWPLSGPGCQCQVLSS